jgi:large subunit ribosomal protein L27
MAFKKATGTTDNLRDSNPKYRWVKIFGGQPALAGNIILRQAGSKYAIGNNVYLGKDFTIHAQVDGIVSFRKKKVTKFDGRVYTKTFVDILPNA